ncbi:hypothetical protein GQ53DRAFT_453975 [Thozetella sp. PMI_491]|nr:hypothetical protein GQ53DRAFT_453975 [Thozetella sp. PMI_491]
MIATRPFLALSFLLPIVLSESCSPQLNGCCYFDFINPSDNVQLTVDCHCNGAWCSTGFSEATPGAITITCPNSGAPYQFAWDYQNGNMGSGTLSGGAQVFSGVGQSSIVTAVQCGFD